MALQVKGGRAKVATNLKQVVKPYLLRKVLITTHQCTSFLARIATVMVVSLAWPLEVGMLLPHIIHPLIAWRLKQLVHLLQQGVSLQPWHQGTHVALQVNV